MKTTRSILLALFWTYMIEGMEVNIALNKTTSMSSSFGAGSPLSEAVVDGVIVNSWGYFIVTNYGWDYAWWKVDLQTQVWEATVEIYFRVDYTKRRDGVQLYTSSSPFSSYPGGQLCHTVTGNTNGSNIPDVLNVTCPGRWRYLMVYTQKNNDGRGAILDFLEAKVLVCSNGTYGSDCNLKCGNCACYRDSGECPPGECLDGWRGENCTQECEANVNYGPGCQLNCSERNCLQSSSCNHVTGQCDSGCHDGWNGKDCTQECSQGTYGTNCSRKCQDRYCAAQSYDCDHVTGACHDSTCQAGWNGTDCTHECPETTYGANCLKSCSTRRCKTSSSVCDRQTGQCPNGCQDGWGRVDCKSRCGPNTFGLDCIPCGSRHCLRESGCPVDGTCSGGCQAGWTLANCTKPCVGGYYGPGCKRKCGHCSGNFCHHVTGQCPGDCQTGWQRPLCQHKCLAGTYGVNCEETCGHCKGPCGIFDGHCSRGCLDGYCGNKCTNKIAGSLDEISFVIGAVVGAVVVLAAIGVLLIYLIKIGRLQWKYNFEANEIQSTVMGLVAKGSPSRITHAMSSTHKKSNVVLDAKPENTTPKI